MSAWIVQVTAGAGPVEVRRFVAKLAEHLIDRCAEEGAQVRDVVVYGDETEPSSVEIHLASAPLSQGSIAGTHALVARSPERGKRSRKRWHAGVRVYEVAETASDPGAIDPRDVTITATRAGGPGGQHVNKTASAVRATHGPSGISVRVTDERSQRDNVRLALARLSRILAERAETRAREERGGRRLFHHQVERGRPAFVYETSRNGELVACDRTCSR